ncbi:MAG: DUF3990 domain-containing protein [Bacteroidales bacterium]|nr:DUF3990 domain-containing protein [Bacteroidales bacterium]
MKLYHGSNIIIEQIDLSKCKPYKDFGQGFYLTEIKEQAEQMARRKYAIYGGEPIVTEFELDEIALKTLSVKMFEEPNEEWALFVMDNRSRKNVQPIHSFDIVIGPVADDTIATYISPQKNRAVKNKSYFYNCYGKEKEYYIENQG